MFAIFCSFPCWTNCAELNKPVLIQPSEMYESPQYRHWNGFISVAQHVWRSHAPWGTVSYSISILVLSPFWHSHPLLRFLPSLTWRTEVFVKQFAVQNVKINLLWCWSSTVNQARNWLVVHNHSRTGAGCGQSPPQYLETEHLFSWVVLTYPDL